MISTCKNVEKMNKIELFWKLELFRYFLVGNKLKGDFFDVLEVLSVQMNEIFYFIVFKA